MGSVHSKRYKIQIAIHHSEENMLYTGIQPLVFHCYIHLVHEGGIWQTCIQNGSDT